MLLQSIKMLVMIAIASFLAACTISEVQGPTIPDEPIRYEADRDSVILFFGDSLKYGNARMSLQQFLMTEFGESLSITERVGYYFFYRSNGVFPLFKPKTKLAKLKESNYSCDVKASQDRTEFSCTDLSGRILQSAFQNERGIIWFDWYCGGISYSVCRYHLKSRAGIFSRDYGDATLR